MLPVTAGGGGGVAAAACCAMAGADAEADAASASGRTYLRMLMLSLRVNEKCPRQLASPVPPYFLPANQRHSTTRQIGRPISVHTFWSGAHPWCDGGAKVAADG